MMKKLLNSVCLRLKTVFGQRFALDVRDTHDHHVTGTTNVLTFNSINSVRYGFNGLSGKPFP